MDFSAATAIGLTGGSCEGPFCILAGFSTSPELVDLLCAVRRGEFWTMLASGPFSVSSTSSTPSSLESMRSSGEGLDIEAFGVEWEEDDKCLWTGALAESAPLASLGFVESWASSKVS